MRQKTRLKASFVITMAGSVAQSAACGGTTAGTLETPSATGGSAERGGAPTHTGGVSIGGSGGTGNVVTNPPEPVVTDCAEREPYNAVVCPAAGQCKETFSCASAAQTFTLDCDKVTGFSINEACEFPFDHCTKPAKPWLGADCFNGHWQLLGVGGNPPSPCPAEAPAVGQSCRPGSFGGDRDHCGYRCPDGTGWTVLSCVGTGAAPAPGGLAPAAWHSDGACSDGVGPAK